MAYGESSKTQAPSTKQNSVRKLQKRLARGERIWNLGLGVYLGVGVWNLGFPDETASRWHRPCTRRVAVNAVPANVRSSSGALAQLVRAPPCHGGGCGFEPRRLRGFRITLIRLTTIVLGRGR